MRAAVFRAPGMKLDIASMPDPVPRAGEIVLKVGRCGICGTDLHMTSGHGMTLPAGTVPGHEFAGEVVALGHGVTSLRVGDRVASMPVRGCGACGACRSGRPLYCKEGRSSFGGLAEYVVTTALESTRLPDSLSLSDGALVEPLAVALHGVTMAGIQPGDHVQVIGAGPIGLGAIYWARRAGAGRITVMEGMKSRTELARTMGATHCIAPEQNPDGDALPLGAYFGPEIPDVVFECVGLPGLLAQAIRKVRTGGTVISLGCCLTPDTILPFMANVKELTIKFPICYSLHDFEVAVRALDAGAVEPRAMITETVGLDAFPDAFERLRAGSGICKLMVDPAA